MNEKLLEIEQWIELNRLKNAEIAINRIRMTEGESAQLLFLQGKLEMKTEKWGEAINSFQKVLELEPGMQAAWSNIEMAKSILNFFNADMLNP